MKEITGLLNLFFSIWAGSYFFAMKPRIVPSLLFFSILFAGILLQIFPNGILQNPFDLDLWKACLGLVSLSVYCVLVFRIQKEFFVMNLEEEDFYIVLLSYLNQEQISYSFDVEKQIPIPSKDSPLKWFYIFSTKTGYIRTKSFSLFHFCKRYMIKNVIFTKNTRLSYEKVVFLFISILFLLKAAQSFIHI